MISWLCDVKLENNLFCQPLVDVNHSRNLAIAEGPARCGL